MIPLKRIASTPEVTIGKTNIYISTFSRGITLEC
jgi:hypothetical protein